MDEKYISSTSADQVNHSQQSDKEREKHSQVNGIWKMTERVDLLSSQGHKHKFLKMSKKYFKHKMPLGSKTHKNNKVSLDTVIKQLILNLQKGVGVTFKSSFTRFTTRTLRRQQASKRQEVQESGSMQRLPSVVHRQKTL